MRILLPKQDGISGREKFALGLSTVEAQIANPNQWGLFHDIVKYAANSKKKQKAAGS
jgi:hypothetical protein